MPLPKDKSKRGPNRIVVAIIVASFFVGGTLAGCSAHDSSSSAVSVNRASTASVRAAGEPTPPRMVGDAQESWFAMFIQGAKVGSGRTSTTRIVERGKTLLRIEEEITFSVSRNGQRTDEKIVSSGVETLDGELLRFQTEINSGQEPIVTRGAVRGGQLAFETTTTGKRVTSAIPWPAAAGGFKATEHSLAKQPMQPGEQRKLAALMVGFNQLAEIEMAAATTYEPVTLLDHSEDLLRIDWTATLPKGNVIRAIWWANHEGEVLKMQLDALHQITYRTTREIALAEGGPMRFDLLRSTIVAVDRPLEHAESTKRARYRVRLESEDPSRIFAASGGQQITPVDPHTAEIMVQSVRPGSIAARPSGNTAIAPTGDSPADGTHERPPAEDDRQPNNLVQSDAPEIVALAKQAAGGKTDSWETAAALERFVHQYITGKNYLKAFSTAVEVAESREGSCTQHAVLLAALARARGIPARVAIGLVYVEDHPGFAFHMWNEVWIGDRWIPLDATRGLGGIGATYLKLADSSLQGESAYSCFLPVAQVIGQAKIEILEAE